MRTLVRELAEMLKQPSDDLPKKLVFHTLVSGFDINYPATDPNAFSTFLTHPSIQVDVEFVALHAPPLIRPGQWDQIRTLPGVREAVERTGDLHLIVTSASSLEDADGMLIRYYLLYAKKLIGRLKKEKAVGDMLWQPLSHKGPIDTSNYDYCALTLISLNELQSRVEKGLQVLLALGPCGRCGRLKSDVLGAILCQVRPLITHLVVDSRSVREMFEAEKMGKASER